MEHLELFGKELIENVRDESMDEYLMIKFGKMKSSDAKALTALISSFSSEDVKKLDKIVLDLTDRVLHNVLRMFDESGDFAIVSKKSAEPDEDIAQLSDGLSGELYGDNGWLNRFSKHH
jgi:hypothetical protein